MGNRTVKPMSRQGLYKIKVRQLSGMNQEFILREPKKVNYWKMLSNNYPWDGKSGIRMVELKE